VAHVAKTIVVLPFKAHAKKTIRGPNKEGKLHVE
jgi:hypothetical protein